MNGSVFLETQKLVIKVLTPEDYPAFMLQQKDPFVMRFFGGPRDDAKIATVFDLLCKHQKKYGFSQGMTYLKETGELIGRAGLVHLDFEDVPEVELASFLFQTYSNKGYSTELCEALISYAFNVLNAPRIYATVDSENIAACRLPEKLGMTFEKEDIYRTLLNKKVKFFYKDKYEMD